MKTLNQIRSMLYRLASILGDINAVMKGKIIQRLVRKYLFRKFSKAINRAIK